MKTQIFLLIAAFVLLVFSCSTQKTNSEFTYAIYSFKSFNIVGEMIGDGTIYINKFDSSNVEGNWSIRNVRGCYVCGPQFGSGYLTGRIENDSMYINLNPNTPQNYVELSGKIEGNTFSGEWCWYESIVNSNRGTFRAVKN